MASKDPYERMKEVDLLIEKNKREAADLKKLKKDLTKQSHSLLLVEAGQVIESVLGRPLEKADIPKLRQYLSKKGKYENYFLSAMKQP